MNIFVLDENPIRAAEMMCDKHIPKMVVESAQMMASAVRRWGATDDVMPLTKAGKPYKGGYPNHPCTVWAGDTFGNFSWVNDHAIALCDEYTYRFGKVHACDDPITTLWRVGIDWVGEDDLTTTPFALAMPDEYRDDDAVQAYRAYYHSKHFAKWEKGTPAPEWWQPELQALA